MRSMSPGQSAVIVTSTDLPGSVVSFLAHEVAVDADVEEDFGGGGSVASSGAEAVEDGFAG